jgi:hypothetical protein
MTQAKNIHELFVELIKPASPAGRQDLETREVVCTDFDGAYGHAGTVIALNGSPPRGIIVSIEADGDHYPPAIFFVKHGSSRRIGDAQARLVRKFLSIRAGTPKP